MFTPSQQAVVRVQKEKKKKRRSSFGGRGGAYAEQC
jgi:hypothetical protein